MPVRWFWGGLGSRPGFHFTGDNEKQHRTHTVDNFLEAEDIRHINWSSKSPNNSTIEHVWIA